MSPARRAHGSKPAACGGRMMFAPLRTGRRRCGQHDSRHLSDEARQAKQQRRRLERRYRRTGLQSDKEAYLSACSTARESILKLRADYIKSELDEAAGDVRATWRTAQRLLHSRHEVVYDDAQCAQLVSTFCQFFVDKVKRIRDNISAALQSSVRRTSAVRQHLGPQLSSFEPVTAEEVRQLLSGMPSKSSLPCSLLKSTGGGTYSADTAIAVPLLKVVRLIM